MSDPTSPPATPDPSGAPDPSAAEPVFHPAGPPTHDPPPLTDDPPTEEHDRLVEPVGDEEPPRLPFPVVGVGASAGGLEAFSEFFQALRPDTGMAFVLIQHLPPDRESLMVDILSKRTPMPVQQVAEGMAVEPDHVYVIRPGHTVTIADGRLHLGESLRKPGHNRPVDDFFKSLAIEQRERAIAVVMSGMGSNGSAGAQAVKAVGGLCIAQDPETAQFPSMPRHLIDQGYADLVLTPRDIPEALQRYAGHPYARGDDRGSAAADVERDPQVFAEVLAFLRTRTKHDFSGYKRPTVYRRIQRRMGLAQVTALGQYAKVLRQSPGEVQALADDLLIHVTGFFRDPDAWESLRRRVVAPLVAEREPESPVRCWVTACSSGEEAYSLAMLLTEAAEAAGKALDVKVFATDMAERALAHARAGVYPGGIESEVSPARLERFFDKEDAVYLVKKELRETVVFAPQNILQDPPFSRLDICSCRNLLIYLEPDIQQRVLSLLHFGLRESGALFLGTSETIGGGAEDLFEPVDKKWRIFRRVGQTRHGRADFPLPRTTAGRPGGPAAGDVAPVSPRPAVRLTVPQLTQRALLERHTPAAVTVDRDHRVLYYHGDTEPFLAQPQGEPTRDLVALAREHVKGAVRTALHMASTRNEPAVVRDGAIETPQGRRRVWVTAAPLDPRAATGLFLVSFEEQREPAPSAAAAEGGNGTGHGGPVVGPDLGDELRRVREELQSAIEELQTSNEELKGSHEELTSINEELQSTNEELETSKEELQSLNEELTTVNAQLQAKMEEHEATSNDLTSLLSSTDIAVLFLDTRSRIRRFTPAVRDLFDVIPSDAGRPLKDLARKFDDPDLSADAEAVLARLAPVEREVTSHTGRTYARRALPYRTADNRIDGVVVTFVDVTARVRATARLAEVARLLDLSNDAIFVRDAGNRVTYWNHGAAELFGWSAAEAVGQDLHRLLRTEHELPPDQLMAELRRRDHLTGEVVQTARDGRRITALCRWALDQDRDGNPASILTTATDITVRQRDEAALRRSEERFRRVVEGTGDFAIFLMDPDLRITVWNPAAERTLGHAAAEAIGRSAALIFTPEDVAAGVPERERATAAREGRAADNRWHVRKDGTRLWASGSLSALRGADGQVFGYVKVLRDETGRKRGEEERAELLAREQAARREAEAATRLKDEFLATLSHELRTPLSAVLLWARLLTKPNLSPPEVAEGLEAIRHSAEAQRELIDDLLDTSRITSGKLVLAPRPVELASVVRTAVDTLLPTAEAKGVRVETDLGPDVGVVTADPDRLRQVVWNLLANAVKFTPAGGRVDVGLWRRGDEVEVRVADTGQGIEPAFLPHVFERFRQADASTTRTQGGLGLGLAIAKQLVELHGGTIRAGSEGPGKGSTFVVTLPLPRVRGPRAGAESMAAAGAALSGGKPARRGKSGGEKATGEKAVARKRRGATARGPAADRPAGLAGAAVLLVEDDPQTRHAMEVLLRSAGAAVTAVESAADGLAAYRSARPDLIVSDIGLPNGDGHGLIRAVRKLEAAAGAAPVPALAVTAYAGDADRKRATAAGFQGHLAKPVDPDNLLAVLGELVRGE